MRPCAGWVAAALLVALAFAGGLDVLAAGPPLSHTQVSDTGGTRGPQVRDGALASPRQIVGQKMPRHLRLAALPPSSQTAAPVPVRGASPHAPHAAQVAVTAVSGRSRPGACTPEALQIFRC